MDSFSIQSVYISQKKGANGEHNNNDGFVRKASVQRLYGSRQSTQAGSDLHETPARAASAVTW